MRKKLPPRRAGVLDGPLVGFAGEVVGPLHHHLGHLGVLRVLGVWRLEEHAERDEGHLNGAHGRPPGAERVEADGSLGDDSARLASRRGAVFLGAQALPTWSEAILLNGTRRGLVTIPPNIQTYRHTADVWVPDLGVELHDGRLEGVHVWDNDVDLESSPRIGRVGRTSKATLEVNQVGGVDGLCENARLVLVIVNVGELLRDPALAGGSHDRDARGSVRAE